MFKMRPFRTFLMLALTILLCAQSCSALNISDDGHFDRALEWVLKSKMVVENPNDALYNGTLPPTGGVFLVFDVNKSEFNWRIHVPSAAEYVRLAADLAGLGYQQAVMSRLKLVSDFLLASTARVNLTVGAMTVVAPVWLHKEQAGWVPIIDESYARDNLNVAQALLQAYRVTKSEGYASRAKELLNTVVLLQSLEEEKVQSGELPGWISGSLPWLMFNYGASLTHGVTFTDLDLSLTDVAWGAFTLGYNIFGDDQYLRSRDEYFDFLLRTYHRSENVSQYPYQFISERAGGGLQFANMNAVEKEWGPTQPFTMDMAFYQVIGLLMNENQTIKTLGESFLDRLSLLQSEFWFDDSYYPATGQPVGYGNATIATSQYLAALNLEGNNTAEEQIKDSIFHFQLNDSTDFGKAIYDGGWEWSPGSGLVESMATIVTIHSLIINSSLVPRTEGPTYPPSSIIIATSVVIATIAMSILIFFVRKRRNKPGQTPTSAR